MHTLWLKDRPKSGVTVRENNCESAFNCRVEKQIVYHEWLKAGTSYRTIWSRWDQRVSSKGGIWVR